LLHAAIVREHTGESGAEKTGQKVKKKVPTCLKPANAAAI
jgi:hypothetical protein